MAPISGAGFWSVCRWLKSLWSEKLQPAGRCIMCPRKLEKCADTIVYVDVLWHRERARVHMLGGVNPRSHCVRRRTSTHARGRTATCIAIRLRASVYGDVVRHRTSTQDTADAKLYATYRCCQWAQLCCGPSSYGDGRQRNATSARSVRHVASGDVRRRSVCERCRRNQRARLQRRRTLTYVNVHSVNGV